mmetsp:Transcript_11794/g.19177  ORF Transcript_11794/g.19177 Transcript_11794/m.19177 type:complete len:155 (-) Transcript_11794:120-584(-)
MARRMVPVACFAACLAGIVAFFFRRGGKQDSKREKSEHNQVVQESIVTLDVDSCDCGTVEHHSQSEEELSAVNEELHVTLPTPFKRTRDLPRTPLASKGSEAAIKDDLNLRGSSTTLTPAAPSPAFHAIAASRGLPTPFKRFHDLPRTPSRSAA